MSNCSKEEEAKDEQFPVGLRVLVVDDDPTCLKIIDKMLRSCNYKVTTCAMATLALSMLRERSGSFDLVITDVYMPDMDGFKLLEHIGLEMDLPVIMMSADVEVKAAMRGLKHGACFYLMKPVRMEELKNIWQHVVRKKKNEYKEHEHQVSGEDSEILGKASDDLEHVSSPSEENLERPKRKKDVMEEDEENDDSSALKKQRVIWLPELHQQFLAAVEKLGTDNAVPKKILELMNVPGLTRENVASHLQKFRLLLRRLNEVSSTQGVFPPTFQGRTANTRFRSNVHERLDFQGLAGSPHFLQQTNLMPLQSGLRGKPHNLNATKAMLDFGSLHLFNQEPQSNNYLDKLRNFQGQPLLNGQRNFPGSNTSSSSRSESKQFSFMQGNNRNSRIGMDSQQLRTGLSSFGDSAISQVGGLDLHKGSASTSLGSIHHRNQWRPDHISSGQFDTLSMAQLFPNGAQCSNFSSTGNGGSYGRLSHIPALDFLNSHVSAPIGSSNPFSGLRQEGSIFKASRDVNVTPASCILDEISKSGKQNQQFPNVVLGLEEKAPVPDFGSSNSHYACNGMVSSGGLKHTSHNGTSSYGTQQQNDKCSKTERGCLSDVVMSLESKNTLLPGRLMQEDLHELVLEQQQDGGDLIAPDFDIDVYQLDDIFDDQL